jgi:hypothetical protein
MLLKNVLDDPYTFSTIKCFLIPYALTSHCASGSNQLSIRFDCQKIMLLMPSLT